MPVDYLDRPFRQGSSCHTVIRSYIELRSQHFYLYSVNRYAKRPVSIFFYFEICFSRNDYRPFITCTNGRITVGTFAIKPAFYTVRQHDPELLAAGLG